MLLSNIYGQLGIVVNHARLLLSYHVRKFCELASLAPGTHVHIEEIQNLCREILMIAQFHILN
jgi:hypothetical protein